MIEEYSDSIIKFPVLLSYMTFIKFYVIIIRENPIFRPSIETMYWYTLVVINKVI